MSVSASLTTADASFECVARRAVISSTLRFNSAREVPGPLFKDTEGTEEAENTETRRWAATTRVAATIRAPGISARRAADDTDDTDLPVAGVRNGEIRERRQVRQVVVIDAVAQLVVRRSQIRRRQRGGAGCRLQHDIQHIVADAASIREPRQIAAEDSQSIPR